MAHHMPTLVVEFVHYIPSPTTPTPPQHACLSRFKAPLLWWSATNLSATFDRRGRAVMLSNLSVPAEKSTSSLQRQSSRPMQNERSRHQSVTDVEYLTVFQPQSSVPLPRECHQNQGVTDSQEVRSAGRVTTSATDVLAEKPTPTTPSPRHWASFGELPEPIRLYSTISSAQSDRFDLATNAHLL